MVADPDGSKIGKLYTMLSQPACDRRSSHEAGTITRARSLLTTLGNSGYR